MKLTTFFEKFDLLAGSVGAVEKMRELVLQLAVQGRLVGQESSEGDADSLLEEIAAARKRTRHHKSNQDVDDERLAVVPGWHQVPPTWRWVHLGAIGDIIGGGTPRSDNSAYFADDGIPWLTPADLNGFEGKRISRGRRCITKLGLENSSAQLLPEGSVLFSSRAPIGYVAIAGTELATNQGFKSCVPFIPETNEFLYYYLMSAAPRIDREASGTTFREVSGRIVSQIPVPLPPLAEQKRIVAKVDELMALCDRLEAQQQERETRHAALARASLARFADAPTPANLPFLFHPSYAIRPADLRKSILTLAVQGKLVPQDPNDEPAEDSPTTATSLPAEVDQTPFEVPSDWRWRKLGAIALVERGGSPRPIKDYITNDPNGLNWIKIGDTEKGGKYITSTDEKIRPEGLAKTRKVYPGDFLLTNSMSFGRPYISKIEGCIHDGWLRIHPPDQVEPDYLYHLLSSPFVNVFFSKAAAGAVVQNLNADKVRELAIPLPPLAEQRRIVAKVEQLMALVDALETQLAACRDTGANLLEAVVAELTSGN